MITSSLTVIKCENTPKKKMYAVLMDLEKTYDSDCCDVSRELIHGAETFFRDVNACGNAKGASFRKTYNVTLIALFVFWWSSR